ncbi:MAG: response regulator [Chthoniobacterales bacterium]|nr:response regulator [Chthoniobacterales bacterium]
MPEDIQKFHSSWSRALKLAGIIVRYWSTNPDSLEILGGITGLENLRFGTIEGGWPAWLSFIYYEDRDTYLSKMQICLRRGEGYDLEYRLQGPTDPVPVRERGYVSLGPNQELKSVVAVIQDIRPILTLENRLSLARKMEAFGQLAGGVAHDFNNMLSVILGYSQLLLDDFSEKDPRLPFIQEIENAARRASSLTNQLLAFTRKEVHEVQLVIFDQILSEMGKMLRRMVGEQIQLKIITNAGNNARLRADPNQIEQMLIHLAVAARDLLPNGGFLTLSTRLETLSIPNARQNLSHLILCAECRSIHRDQNSFTEGSIVPWNREIGAISTCESIVKENGGWLELSGSSICPGSLAIFFPISTKLLEQFQKSPSATPDPQNKRILLVEDDAGVRTLARVVLTRAGFEVTEAENGIAAIKAANSIHPKTYALIITDIIMPGMGGIEMIRQILNLMPKVPVIFLSGYHEQVRSVAEAKLPTNYSFLRKPFPVSELSTKVREILSS